MREGARFELRDAEEAIVAMREIGEGARVPVLVDMRGVLSQTREAREYFMQEDAARVSAAVALLVDSPLSRLLGNFFLLRGAHRVPTRLFTEEQAAVRWLAEHAP